MEILPASLVLGVGDTGEARLVMTNSSEQSFTVADIDVVPAPRVSAELTDIPPDTVLAAGTSKVGTLEVAALPGLSKADLTVVIEVISASGSTLRLSDSVAVSTSEEGKALFDVAFDGIPGQLNDGQCRTAFVVLTNRSTSTLTRIEVSPLHNGDVDIVVPERTEAESAPSECGDLPDESAPTSIAGDLAGGEAMRILVELHAPSQVTPGAQEIAVTVSAEPVLGIGDAVPPVSRTAEGTIDLHVFGVDSLSPFGLSVLFVVPGVLAVVAFLTLSRTVYPRKSTAPDTVQLTDFRLMPWIIAVGAGSYLLVWFFFGHDLTRRTGTGSVAILLAIGAGIGVLAWAVVAIAYYLAHGRKLVTLTDDPLKLLRRLHARNVSLDLPAHLANRIVYLVVAPETTSTSFAAPQIRYRIASQGDAATEDEVAFARAIGTADYSTLISMVKRGAVKLEWSDANGIRVFEDSALSAATSQKLLTPVVTQ